MAADVEKGLERVRREAGSPVGRGPPPTGNEGAWSVEWGHSKPGLSCSSGTASLTSTPESLPGPISHLPARRRAQSALTQATSTRGGVLPLGCCPRPLEPLPCLCTLTWSRSVSCSCSTLIDLGQQPGILRIHLVWVGECEAEQLWLSGVMHWPLFYVASDFASKAS